MDALTYLSALYRLFPREFPSVTSLHRIHNMYVSKLPSKELIINAQVVIRRVPNIHYYIRGPFSKLSYT